MKRISKLILIALVAVSCGKKSDSSSSSSSSSTLFSYSKLAMEASPQDTTGAKSLDGSIEKSFFKLECHMPDQVDYCPTGVTADTTNKFTVSTLLGAMYHAEMYAGNVFRDDKGYQSCTAVSGSASTSAPTFTTTSELVVGATSTQFGCVGSEVYGSQDTANYFAYSKSPADTFYSFVALRPGVTVAPYAASYDILQGYVRRASDASVEITAFNIANKNTVQGRTVGLMNVSTGNFVVKYHTGSTASQNYIIAIGTAGYDIETSTFKTGYYAVKADNGGVTTTKCYANAAVPTVQADMTNCAAGADYLTGGSMTWTASNGAGANQNLKEFLGLATEDVTILEEGSSGSVDGTDSYKDIFNDGTTIGIAAPTATSQFPTSITAN